MEKIRVSVNISIHVPRVGDDVCPELGAEFDVISIHVPRVGDDTTC